MGFDALLGNDRLKQNLTRSLAKGHVSHFYLISGPEGSGKHTLAKLLAAAILCQGTDKPCGPAALRCAGLHRSGGAPVPELHPLPQGDGRQPPGLHHRGRPGEEDCDR